MSNQKPRHRSQHAVQSTWTVYAHDKSDENFTNCSYKKCYSIRTLEDMWVFFNNIQDFSRHQLYFMRGDIPPKYECPQNVHGGCCSVCVQAPQHVKSVLIAFVVRLISEQFLYRNYYNQITGLYMAPKTHGALIKIWFRNYDWLMRNASTINLKGINHITPARFKKHLNRFDNLK